MQYNRSQALRVLAQSARTFMLRVVPNYFDAIKPRARARQESLRKSFRRGGRPGNWSAMRERTIAELAAARKRIRQTFRASEGEFQPL